MKSDPTTRGVRSRAADILLPVLGCVTVIGLWWLATIAFNIKEFFLPAPPAIVTAFKDNYQHLWQETQVTLKETAYGFGIAAVAGILMAMLLTASRLVERAFLPLLIALNSIPKVALTPLLIVWMGFGVEPRILLVVLISFFPIVVSSMAGFTSTPGDLGELTRSLTATWWRTYLKIRIPWALPQVFVGLKVAISLAVIGAVVAEIGAPNQGLGSVILLSGQSFDTPMAFAAIVVLAAMSIILFYLMELLERLLLPWAREISA
jgi:NitT/TauT family transport system permease protein